MNHYSSVYKRLTKITKINFAKELQETDILLEDLFVARNLITEKKMYILIVNGYCVRFISPANFIDNFCSLLVESIREQEKEYERLQGLENEFTDEIQLDIAIKHQYRVVYKQKELLKKMYEQLKEIRNEVN